MIRSCINCGSCFETNIPKKVSCSRKCSQNWRRENVYKDKYTLKYRAASPRNFLQCLAKKKAERRDLDLDFLVELYTSQRGLCAISGIEMTYITGSGRVPTNISIDRIDSSIGYVKDNIQLVCRQVNIMKAELSTEELISWCKQISGNRT